VWRFRENPSIDSGERVFKKLDAKYNGRPAEGDYLQGDYSYKKFELNI